METLTQGEQSATTGSGDAAICTKDPERRQLGNWGFTRFIGLFVLASKFPHKFVLKVRKLSKYSLNYLTVININVIVEKQERGVDAPF